jgi:YHS domain-containing protein
MSEESTPEFGGKCALGVGLGGPAKAPDGKAKYSLEKDGKTYIFSGAVPRLVFKTFPGLAAKAQAKFEAASGSAAG